MGRLRGLSSRLSSGEASHGEALVGVNFSWGEERDKYIRHIIREIYLSLSNITFSKKYIHMTNPRNIGEEKEVWVECGEVVANADEATISAFAAT